MCNQNINQVICLAMFFTYQFALLYGWIIFILASQFDVEVMYFPRRITGKVFSVYPYNMTDE